MTTPPTIMIGTGAMKFSTIKKVIWICCTSLVPRVIKVAAPKWETSSAEKSVTRSKTSARTSRPTPMEVRAPNQMAMLAEITCTNATASMIPPMRQMNGTSPWDTPSSMMRALREGRYSVARVEIVCKTRMAAIAPR